MTLDKTKIIIGVIFVYLRPPVVNEVELLSRLRKNMFTKLMKKSKRFQ